MSDDMNYLKIVEWDSTGNPDHINPVPDYRALYYKLLKACKQFVEKDPGMGWKQFKELVRRMK